MRFFLINALLSVSNAVRWLTLGRVGLVRVPRLERVSPYRKLPKLLIVPSEGVSPLLVVLCCHVIKDVFNIDAEVSEEELDVERMRLEVSGSTFLDADGAVEHLYTPTYTSADKVVMLITTRPLKAKNDEGNRYDVYGLAVINWGVSVVSTAISVCIDPNMIISRKNFAKVVVHEVGHMLGLSHCPWDNCVMNNVVKAGGIDSLSSSFCERCQQVM